MKKKTKIALTMNELSLNNYLIYYLNFRSSIFLDNVYLSLTYVEGGGENENIYLNDAPKLNGDDGQTFGGQEDDILIIPLFHGGKEIELMKIF